MKIDFYKINGEKDQAVEFPKTLESSVSDARILEYVRYVRNSLRTSQASTKDRSEVSGTGKKPWKQKGTGRARHGSKRSPIWVGGGVAFGPTSDKNYHLKINKRERRQVVLSLLTEKVKDKTAYGLSDFAPKKPSTKKAAQILEIFPIKGKFIMLSPRNDDNILKSFQNIAVVTLATCDQIDIISLISADALLLTNESLKELKDHYIKPVSKTVREIAKLSTK